MTNSASNAGNPIQKGVGYAHSTGISDSCLLTNEAKTRQSHAGGKESKCSNKEMKTYVSTSSSNNYSAFHWLTNTTIKGILRSINWRTHSFIDDASTHKSRASYDASWQNQQFITYLYSHREYLRSKGQYTWLCPRIASPFWLSRHDIF